ncbi:MAG: hypothetical protein ABIO96_10035 [Nitrospiraceae bacterium]
MEGSLGVVHAMIQEMQRSIRVVLGIENNIKIGSKQRQSKQLTLDWALFDQKDDGCVTIYIGGYQQGMCRARK